ncbi:MAG: methyltransferase domain-containing protein [Sphingobacteriaceae bacterium]|nr:MAG: methyltransferase domain-containing protein [Sphingobacteriaceae bacterium]
MFHFKQFSIDQTGCAMKINTDGVLLGALADADEPEHILDIGTGTGVIALMLAQRFANAMVDAVEIDKTAAHTARDNFQNSKFADRLHLFAHDFESYFSNHPQKKYDLVVSNPPFYINSLESPEAKKNTAKHADGDFFDSLVKSVSKHLSETGTFWLILPLDTAELVKTIAQQNNLYLQKVIAIKSYPDSVPHREILVFGLNDVKAPDEEFVIYREQKVYSDSYVNKLRDFFTIFK